MKKILLLLLLLIPSIVFARPATVTFDESITQNVTYNVYKNNAVIYSDSTSLTYDVQANAGDVFYVTSVLNGTESEASNKAEIPHAPPNMKITIIFELSPS